MPCKKKPLKIFNAFTPGMLPLKVGEQYDLEFMPIDVYEATALCACRKIRSYIGHESLAEVLTELLEVKIKFNRRNVKVNDGEEFLIAKKIQRRTNFRGVRGEGDEKLVFLRCRAFFKMRDPVPLIKEPIR